MTDKPTHPVTADASQLSDSDLQLAYEKARAALQKKNQEALDATNEEQVFEVYNAERERRSKSDLKTAAHKKD